MFARWTYTFPPLKCSKRLSSQAQKYWVFQRLINSELRIVKILVRMCPDLTGRKKCCKECNRLALHYYPPLFDVWINLFANLQGLTTLTLLLSSKLYCEISKSTKKYLVILQSWWEKVPRVATLVKRSFSKLCMLVIIVSTQKRY